MPRISRCQILKGTQFSDVKNLRVFVLRHLIESRSIIRKGIDDHTAVEFVYDVAYDSSLLRLIFRLFSCFICASFMFPREPRAQGVKGEFVEVCQPMARLPGIC